MRQNESKNKIKYEESEYTEKIEKSQDEAAEKLEQGQDEAAEKVGQEQKESAEKMIREQGEAAEKLEQGQGEAADKMGQEQKESAEKMIREQGEAAEKLEQGYVESHDKFKREIKESIEHLKKDHQVTQDTLKTRHAETRDILKNTNDSNTLEILNVQTEKEIVSHHEDEVNTLQKDYQTSLDRLDAENKEALSKHRQSQIHITEKLKIRHGEIAEKLGREQKEAADKLGREQKEAIDKLGREQKEAADKLGREQKESRRKLCSSQLETKNSLKRLQSIAAQTMVKNRTILIISTIVLVVGIGFAVYSVYVAELAGKQYQVSNLGKMPTNYVIQDLRGDTIDTWLSWRLVAGSTIHVGITNAAKYPEKIHLIREVIMSEESVDVDDSLLHKGPSGTTSKYYIGWQGALKQASVKSTEFYIPAKLEVVESTRGEGEITIILTNEKNGDGYAGYTKSIADKSQNQILKSTITIYDVNNLNDEQFKTILRHEFGHTLGLAHSTAPEELMAPIIQTSYPYISECVIDTITKLYDGGKNSQVICEK